MAENDNSTPTWVEKVERLGAAGVTLIVFVMLGGAMVFAARTDMSANQTFTSIVETLKNLALLGAGFWLGNSKSGQDTSSTLSNIVKQSAVAPSSELITALKDNTSAAKEGTAAATAAAVSTEANTSATTENTGVTRTSP